MYKEKKGQKNIEKQKWKVIEKGEKRDQSTGNTPCNFDTVKTEPICD